jgi:hypothetical protein
MTFGYQDTAVRCSGDGSGFVAALDANQHQRHRPPMIEPLPVEATEGESADKPT